MQDRLSIDKDALVERMLDGVVVCRPTGEIVYYNPVFERILGYRKGDLKDKDLSKEVVYRELEWKALISLIEQGSPIEDYEIKFRRADGSPANMAISAASYMDPEGVPTGISMTVRDISTRKGVENDLREKAFRTDIINRIAKLAGASNSVPDIIGNLSDELKKLMSFDRIGIGVREEDSRHVEFFAIDPQKKDGARSFGKVQFEGSLIERLESGKKAIIIEKDLTHGLFSEFSTIEGSDINSVVSVPLRSRNRVIGSLNVLHSKQGEYNWESAETLQLISDQIAGMIDNIVLLRSLEEKIKLHEMLMDSALDLQKAINTEQVYAAIASHLRQVVPYQDLSFYLIDWRRRYVYPVYVVGSYTDEIMAFAGGLEGIVGHIARSGKPEIVDDIDADPRGEEIPGTPAEHNSMLGIPLVGTEGVIGVLEIYREKGQLFSTSDLEAGMLFAQQASVALANSQLISKLQDANREIELLNDLMFHDINNYNFATLNYIETVSKSGTVPESIKGYLDKSLHLIRQNAKLIENVKKLTKIGGIDSDDFTVVNVADTLAKIVSGLEHSTVDKSLSIDVKLPEGGAYVMANALIDELFVNLLSNAVKYDPHDEVEIDVECTKVLNEGQPCWRVCISDRGYGIPDDKKQLLFQKYVRLKPDSKVSGTGLGLSIVKALVEKFSGNIWVEDRVAGQSDQGARFCVELPAVRRPEPEAE
jgi:PAS domain S-box-containing protein